MLYDRTLLTNFQTSGFWWSPHEPTHRWFGTIVFHHDGLSEVTLWVEPPYAVHTTYLHGVLMDSGDEVTLCGLRESGSQNVVGSHGSCSAPRYVVRYVVIGAHVHPATRVVAASLEFTDLETWIWQDIARDIPPKTADSYWIQNGTRFASMSLGISQNVETTLTSSSVQAAWHIQLSPPQPWTVNDCVNAATDIANFLSVLFGRPVYVRSCSFVPEEISPNPYLFFSTMPKILNSTSHPLSFLVPYLQFKPSAESAVAQWFSVLERYRPVIGLYTSNLFGPAQFLEFRFLALIQGLEGYHRRRYPDGKYISDSAYETVIQPWISKMPQALGTDHRASLQNRVKFGNEYSLRKRLNGLLKALSIDHQSLITNGYRPSDFVDTVVNTRNYLTHYTDELARQTANGADLRRLTARLGYWLAVLLLDVADVSVSPDHVRQNFAYFADLSVSHESEVKP